MPDGNPANVSALGPGRLFIAALGSTEPTDLATPWPVAWTQLGYTDEGSEFSYQVNVEKVEVAEELEPIVYATTSRELSISAALAEITARNLQVALNGGTIVTGSGFVTFTPPALGAEVRSMIGWESTVGDERLVIRKCISAGNIAIARKKAPAKATIPVQFMSEVVAGTGPYKHILAKAA